MKKLFLVLAIMIVAAYIRPEGFSAFISTALYFLAGWIVGDHDGKIKGRRDALSGGTNLK